MLPDDKNIKSCKTGRAKKSSSPIWDEYFVIDGIAQSQLQKKQLGIRVVNWHLGFNRKNSRLGELRIGCTEAFDFQTLPRPNTPRGLKSPRKEETVNEGIVVEARHKKRDFGPPSRETERKVVEKSVSDTLDNVFFEKDQSYFKAEEKRNGGNNSSHDNEKSENKRSSTLLENLKKLNGARNGGGKKETDEEQNVGGQHAKTDEDTISDENEKKLTSSKPRRPPPPNLLKLKELYLSNNNSTPKQDQENENNLKKPASPRKANTPTMSRLLMKLPMSPSHDRRSSWGGESDISLSSPRSASSPGNYEGLESRQWDIMINKPKEWIYCWQKLDVFNSSE